MTEWKQVKGHEGYEVSSDGRVRTNKRIPKILKHNGKGYRLGNSLVSTSTLMRTHFPYEWLSQLDDDEEAAPIKDFDAYYITNKGRIFSMASYRWLTPDKVKSKEYYWKVLLHQDNRRKDVLVHQLVGRHFLEYKEGLCVLHKNEALPYPNINFATNLWLGTIKENNDDKIEKGRHRYGCRYWNK